MTQAGATFAGYRLEELLATDTVSATYRATQRTHNGAGGRALALRVTHTLSTPHGPDAEAIAAYIRSVSEGLRINHPALATIADAGEVDDRVYVATALIDGVTLGRYIRDNGHLAPDDAVVLLRDVADGLDRAHAAGVVHGAISPRTIIVRRSGGTGPAAVLHGFGLRTLLARQARIGRGGIDVPDVEYVAPEQLRGAPTDGRTDQYALACALFHCVTGRPPFVRDTVTGLFGAHLFAAAPVLSDLNGRGAVAGAVHAGLGKQPDSRHATCIDLLRAAVPTADLPASRRGSARGAVTWPEDANTRAPGRPRAAGGPGAATGGRGRSLRTRRARRRGLRLGGRRWPSVPWPVAAMLVLTGIVCTLGLAAVVTGGPPGARDRRSDDAVAVGSLAATGDTPVAADAQWQRRLSDESIYDVQVAGDTVIAATPHGVYALSERRGAAAWTGTIDVGVLTDLAVTDDIVVRRAAQLDGLDAGDGVVRWRDADLLAPISSLVSDAGVVYGIGPGQLTPELVALDAATGRQRWHYGGGDDGVDSDATVVAGDDMAALLEDDALSLVAADGPASTGPDGRTALDDARWREPIADPWFDSLALVPDAVIAATRSGDVCAFDPADGTQRWCTAVAGLADRSPTIVAEGDVIAVVTRSRVTALTLASGARQWSFAAPHPLTTVATGTADQVVVSEVGGRAHGLDLERGFERWRASGFGQITALAATEDAVYAGTRSGVLVRVPARPRVDPS